MKAYKGVTQVAFPARAGMSPYTEAEAEPCESIPRPRGDEPVRVAPDPETVSIPRPRGDEPWS